MKSFLSYLRRFDRQAVVKRQPKYNLVNQKLQSLTASILIAGAFVVGIEGFLVTDSATAAPTRKDWCGTIWSVENLNTLNWVNPVTGATTNASGPTSQITMPGGSMGTSVAAIGIHKESGTMFAFDRAGNTGTLYKYKFGVDTSWQSVAVTGLIGSSGTQTIPGASANLNKMTVDGNLLYLSDSNGIALYSVPLNSSGAVIGTATAQTYSYVGDPAGTPPHQSFFLTTDPVGTAIMNGGDITTDEYGDTYNVSYNNVATVVGGATAAVTKAYFYKQDPVARTWIYQGETATNANFAGAAFYKGDLFVKAALQLKKVDLVRSGNLYTGWNNPLLNIGAPSGIGIGSVDLTACGSPNIIITKTQQIYTDAAATTLAADQTKVRTGQYIKYIITAKNTGDAFARSANLADNLPISTSYVPNSATLNGTNLGLATYPTTGFSINSPGQTTGIIPFAPDPDTATLNFVVQVTALAGAVQNRATITYVDNSGLTSEVSNCTAGSILNCGDSPSLPIETTVSGTVFNDTNGGTIDGTGTNAGSSTLTAYLVSTATTPLTIAKATVAANGTYSFPGVTPGSYTVRISNDATGAVGVAPPAASLPATYVNTGEGVGATPTTSDATINGSTPITVTSDSLINVNFGIQVPVTPPFVGGTCQADGLVWVAGANGEIGHYRVSNQAFTTLSNGTGKVWGDIAWGSNNKLYGVESISSLLYEINPTTGASTAVTSLAAVLTNTIALSGLPDGSLLVGGSGAKTYRQNLTTPSNPPTLWHDFGTNSGNPSGDFILFNNKIYVAWSTIFFGNRLYEVTINSNYDYVSHRDLGALPASSFGLGLVNNQLYIAANTTLYRIDSIPTAPVTTIPVTAVMPTTPYSLYGASSVEESFGGCTSTDYGDAPDTGTGTGSGNYKTTTSDNGPRHTVVTGLKLGANTDGDPGTLQNAAATGDDTNGTPDDEDAFTSLPNVPSTGAYSLTNIPITNTTGSTATLHGWVDFNKNGSFEASEYQSATVASGATSANLNWTVPAGTAAGATYARFRLTTQALTDDTATTAEDERSLGLVSNGEVEDYQVSIIASKANVLLVKRITAIKDGVTGNSTTFGSFMDDTTSTTQTNDNHCNWPTATGTAGACTNTYTVGATSATAPKVKPGDEIEYTIYYLNAGNNKAKQLQICDQLDSNLTFQNETFTTPATIAPLNIQLFPGTGPVEPLTNATGDDKGQVTTPTLAGTSCNLTGNTGTNRSNNVVVVDVAKVDSATPANSTTLSGSTGAGIPTTSYGYIRIRTTVK